MLLTLDPDRYEAAYATHLEDVNHVTQIQNQVEVELVGTHAP